MPNVIVSRTFSKAYSLCFQRVGYFVAHPEIIVALDRIRDSYNVNGLGQIAALATLSDLAYYKNHFRQIKETRARLGSELEALGFKVCPSPANFILVKPPKFPARQWLAKLRDQKILVRWFDLPDTRQFLRVTIGSDREADALLKRCEKFYVEGPLHFAATEAASASRYVAGSNLALRRVVMSVSACVWAKSFFAFSGSVTIPASPMQESPIFLQRRATCPTPLPMRVC